MYSTTVSSVSTARIQSEFCEISPISSAVSITKQPCFHNLDDSLSRNLCSRHLERHHEPRTGRSSDKMETECIICEKSMKNIENTIHQWSEKQMDTKCTPLELTRCETLKLKKNIKKATNAFEKSLVPWYIPSEPDLEVPMYKRFYCYPKMAMILEIGFSDYRKIIELAKNGFNLFIVNLQYGTRDKHQRTFQAIDRAKRKLEQNPYIDLEIGVLSEITDPKLTTGLLKNNAKDVYLDRDSRLVLTSNRRLSLKGSHEIVYVNFSNFVQDLCPKDIIKVGSEVELEVTEALVKSVICRVKKAGLLKPKDDVHLPEMRNQVGKYISNEEEEDIQFILENSWCDYVVCPCAHNLNVCQYIRWFMATHQRRIFIIGKISPDGYGDTAIIEKIVQEFSGIWVVNSRVEAPTIIEKHIVSKCKAEGRPLLRSADFIQEPHLKLPRERNTCRNLLLFPDCLVFKSCLMTDICPTEIRSIIRNGFPRMNDETLEYTCAFMPRHNSAPHMLIRQLALSAIFEKASCVVMVNNTGRSAALLSQNRIPIPIVASVRDDIIARRLLIWKNVTPLLYFENIYCEWSEELDDRIAACVEYAKRFGYITKENVFIISFDSQRGCKYADTFRLASLNCLDDDV